jgi:type VI secretion system protein VasD
MKNSQQLGSLLLLCGALVGCAAGGLADLAMRSIGPAKEPEVPDALKAPRTVNIDLHAAAALNLDATGRPLALLARLYKLRQNGAFERAPFTTFLNPQLEKETLGDDLLEVKDIILIPGQHYSGQEKVGREAYFIGVVALFRAPAPQRWRLSYSAVEAEQAGLAIGANACGLANGSGAMPVGVQVNAMTVHCQ